MDQPFKTLLHLLLVFAGTLLLVSCLRFSIRAAQARSTLAETVEYLEIYGYDAAAIQNKEEKSGTHIQVTPQPTPQGSVRYAVSVSFEHVFAWIRLRKQITYQSLTRPLEA